MKKFRNLQEENEAFNPEVVTITVSEYLTKELAEKIADFQWQRTDKKAINAIRHSTHDGKHDLDCFNVIAVNSQNDVVGRLYCLKNNINSKLWYYGDLSVAPAYRRNKIASRMIDAAIEKVSESGGEILRAYVEPSNTVSIKLQKSLGFSEKPYEKFNELINDGQIMFERRINGISRKEYSFEKIVDEQILYYAQNSLQERFHYPYSTDDTVVFTTAKGKDICRIVISCNMTMISVKEKLAEKLKVYLKTTNLNEVIQKPTFCRELLQALGLNPSRFTLEPTDELALKKHYNCSHTLEFVCNKQSFKPVGSKHEIRQIHRGDKDFKLEDNFGDTMYCIYKDSKLVSTSFYRPNHGKFEGTYAMQVSTKKEYRGNGYGKSVANEATADICSKDGLALWVCQVENEASIKIAKGLGYVFLGGELRIRK